MVAVETKRNSTRQRHVTPVEIWSQLRRTWAVQEFGRGSPMSNLDGAFNSISFYKVVPPGDAADVAVEVDVGH